MNNFTKWQAGILSFEATRDYENPFLDICVNALFTGPDGATIAREAYWDGGHSYKISFAPTQIGTWKYSLSAPADSGLDRISGELNCEEYTGNLAIYKHGFLRVSDDNYSLCYNDGTPFFWLGDTHWGFVSGEKWDESNHPKMSSMFKGMVDRRTAQKFTVYQTNLRSEPRMGATHYWSDDKPLGELPDVEFYQNVVDKRFKYIADAGLVNALGFAWGMSVIGQQALQNNLARYIVARYGAYPMVWTLAGEVAGYSEGPRQALIDGWREVALLVEKLDGYNQLQTAHYTNERPFANYYNNESWYDFTLNQAGHGDFPISLKHFKEYRTNYPAKPFIESESLYEYCSTLEENGKRLCTADMLRRVAYMSVQLGGCGYTYGAQGIWDTVYEKPDPTAPKGFFNVFNAYGIAWFEAIDAPGGYQMTHMRDFYEATHFETMRPAPELLTFKSPFRDEALFGMYAPMLTSNSDRSTIVAYFTASSREGSSITGLRDGVYSAEWFDPRTGKYISIDDINSEGGLYEIPTRPESNDFLLKLMLK